jgi:hypothetical protein
MDGEKIEVRQVSSVIFELLIPEELYVKLKEAADSVGAASVDSFVSECLLPARLADISRNR